MAGAVDSVGFLSLGGFFVSFMSGNSTRLGVALAAGQGAAALTAAGLIATFVIGVALASIIGHRFALRTRAAALTAIQALLLSAAAALHLAGFFVSGSAAMVLAMAVANAVFERDGEIPFGVTYMTGALVRVGQQIAAIARGGRAGAWLPHALLWAALTGGAVGGGLLHAWLGLAALWWLAAGVAAMSIGLAITARAR